jgi:chromosome segregation ATPase
MSSEFLKQFDANLVKLDRQILESRRVSTERKKTFGFVAGKLQDLNAQVTKLADIVKLLKQRTNGISANRGDNSGQIENNKREIARLNQIIQQLGAERNQIKQGFDRCNAQMLVKNREIEAASDKLTNSLRDLQARCDQEIKRITDANQGEQEQNKQLTEQVRALSAELDTFRANPVDKAGLEAEIQRLTGLMDGMTQDGLQSNAEITKCKRDLDDLNRRLANSEGEMQALVKERDGLRDQLQAMTSGNVPIEARIKELTDANVRLLAENEMLLKKLNDAQNAIIQATTVLQQLSGKPDDFDTIDALIGSLEQMLTDISRNAQQQGGRKRKKSKTRKRRRRTQSGGFIYGKHSNVGKGISRRRKGSRRGARQKR